MGRKIKLRYQVAPELHNLTISMGIGPYSYGFRGNGEERTQTVISPTLYGSYFITDDIHVVGFGLTTLGPHNYTDLGLYLRLEYFRFLDRRGSLNLLIGGHVIGFEALDQFYGVVSAPQGFELMYRDVFQRGKNLTAGAFIYPLISGNAYYNLWVRWGRQVFFELNYIAWHAQPKQAPYQSTSFGASVGFPLLRLW
jgi:hypothetical protein